MGREGESAQGILFAGELLEPPSPSISQTKPFPEADPVPVETELSPLSSAIAEPAAPAPECHKWTVRELRAVRSLLYNRLLLEVVGRRIEKAETVLLSFLLTQVEPAAQIGPYLVELQDVDHLQVTQTETDGWYQARFSELHPAGTGNL